MVFLWPPVVRGLVLVFVKTAGDQGGGGGGGS